MATSTLLRRIINRISLSYGAGACLDIAYQNPVWAEATGYVFISNRDNKVVD
jgi:hypothetical protein